ncbi:MAG: hypothetical protein E6K14_06265 [Methanobacteriota archaeon]|nr:MAG: hypothetical protein E6K14_06265 [Euryarchaeota archaeon]
MKLSRSTLLWILIVSVLVAIELGVVTGLINPSDPITSLFTFLLAVAAISILSIVGAVFVGMLVSHRILSTQSFTPFEQEMLHMRGELRELTQQIEQIAERLGVPFGDKKKGP